MMRPKSALYYSREIEDIATELLDKIAGSRDGGGRANISTPCQEFALESIGLIFLGSRLGALQGSEDGRQLIESMGHLMAWSFPMLILPLKVGRLPDHL